MGTMNVRHVGLLFLSILTTACGVSTITIYEVGDAGPDASDAGTDDAAMDAAGAKGCNGQCAPLRPLGWSDPILVAKAPPGTKLSCPAEAPVHHFTKYADMTADPLTCSCACRPSTGSCKLPTTMSAHNATCNASATISTPSDPPPGWDGSCSAANPISGGALCDGKPCVESLTIGPMEAVDDGCEVDELEILKGAGDTPTWGVEVIGCEGFPEEGEVGCGSGAKCAPNPTPPPEFRLCVYKEDDVPCEGEDYTDRFVIYEGYDDQRDCSACTCAQEVEGSACSAMASIYTDNLCVDPLVLGYPVSSIKEGCFDLTIPGQALGSKAISNVKYHAGTCQPSGGEPIGGVELLRPSTICCKKIDE